MNTKNCVFVVDDDPAACDSVTALIRSKGVAVQSYSSAEQFLAEFDRSQPGCLIVDVRMSGMTGLELQQALIEESVPLAVIVITGYADIRMAVAAMQAGAVNFLEKPCQDQELWVCVQRALAKEDQIWESHQQRKVIVERLGSLTKSEISVLERIVDGKLNKQIAGELDIGLRTAELRRAKVMDKMKANSPAELVRMALTAELLPNRVVT